MKYDRVIIGYHGCDEKAARDLLNGARFKPSQNDYDWLGRGIYFWEYGPDRAYRFAEFQKTYKKVETPAVVGALIQLGNCFDLLDTRFTSELRDYFLVYKDVIKKGGATLPVNGGKLPDKKLRRGDCALINHYLTALEKDGKRYDSVRGCFVEGEAIYPDSGFSLETHIQIAVRNPECIVGVFKPGTHSSR